MSDRYASDLPLPGGVEQYYDTLVEWLKHVREEPCSHDALMAWITQQYPSVSQATAISHYIGLVSRMSLWTSKDDQIKLTQEGLRVLEKSLASPDDGRRAVAGLKLRDVAGYDVLLKYLAGGERTFEDTDEHLKKSLGTDWKTKNQTNFRMNWLRSLGLVAKEGHLYRLTEEGRSLAARVEPSVPEPGPKPVPRPEPAPQKTCTPLLDSATQVADRVECAAKQGGDGSEFESAVAAAFNFLGYTTKLIGGSGNPDIVATALMGEATYRVVVETKSRGSGVINQNDVNFDALKEHKAKADADSMVVIGPEFSGGNLEKWSKERGVTLMRTEDLRKVLLAHAEAVIPLDVLGKLWTGGGSLDEAILSEVLADSENTVQSVTLARDVYHAVQANQDEEGVLTAHSLYYVLQRAYSIQSIDKTIGLLRSDLIGALGQSSKGSLYTRLAPRTLHDRMRQLSELMAEKPAEPTPVA
jgi:hypothetical protein